MNVIDIRGSNCVAEGSQPDISLCSGLEMRILTQLVSNGMGTRRASEAHSLQCSRVYLSFPFPDRLLCLPSPMPGSQLPRLILGLVYRMPAVPTRSNYLTWQRAAIRHGARSKKKNLARD